MVAVSKVVILPLLALLALSCQQEVDAPVQDSPESFDVGEAPHDSGETGLAVFLDAGRGRLGWVPDCPNFPQQDCWHLPPRSTPREPQPPGDDFDHFGCIRPSCSQAGGCPGDLVCIGGVVVIEGHEHETLEPQRVDGVPMCVMRQRFSSMGNSEGQCMLSQSQGDPMRCGWGSPGAYRCVYPEVLERWPILEQLVYPRDATVPSVDGGLDGGVP